MIDESTDLSVEQKMSLCVRYMYVLDAYGSPQTSFMRNIYLENGKAHTIVQALCEFLQRKGVDMNTLVGLGKDGAANMIGKHMGVGVQIETKYAPFVIQTHCVANRLAVACMDAVKTMKQIETFKIRFNILFYHFNASV